MYHVVLKRASDGYVMRMQFKNKARFTKWSTADGKGHRVVEMGITQERALELVNTVRRKRLTPAPHPLAVGLAAGLLLEEAINRTLRR